MTKSNGLVFSPFKDTKSKSGTSIPENALISQKGLKLSQKASLHLPQDDVPRAHNARAGFDLDTLGQLRKGQENQAFQSVKNLQKRARSKFYTAAFLKELVSNENLQLHSMYQRAVSCSSILSQKLEENGYTLKTRYCDSRVCNVCNRIRTAYLINGYGMQLQEFSKMFFVTLTAPTVSENDLKEEIPRRQRAFKRVLDNLRKQGIKPKGVRKTEVTYNHSENWYHPHFHLIVDGYNHAQMILKAWMEQFPDAKIYGQDIREANKDSLNELFKYTTKIAIKSNEAATMEVDSHALNVIMEALYKKRTFQPFGGLKKIVEEIDERTLNSIIYKDVPEYDSVVWYFDQEANDWHTSDGELLTGYQKPKVNFKYKKHE